MSSIAAVPYAGLGLRRKLLPDLLTMSADAVDFLEVAPDNWIGVGGLLGEQLPQLADRFPISPSAGPGRGNRDRCINR